MSRVRGNNQEETSPDDLDSLEESIGESFKIIGKEKVYELLIKTFPEDFEDEE